MRGPIQNNKVFELMQQQGVLTQRSPLSNLIQTKGTTFDSLLREQIHLPNASVDKFGVKVSKHAQRRMEERNIQFEDNDWKIVKEGLKQAAMKNSKQSLFVMDNALLVVSVPNSTVITAVEREKLKNNVFTNIDSTVILPKDTILEEKQKELDPLGDLNQGGISHLLSSLKINGEQKI